MEPELPNYIKGKRTKKRKTNIGRTRRKLKSNTTNIVYLLVLCHGSLTATRKNGEVKLKMTNIPKKMKLFNKLTHAPVGLKNWITSGFSQRLIDAFSNTFRDFDQPRKAPLVGDNLKEIIQGFDAYRINSENLQRYIDNPEVKKLVDRKADFFEVSLNKTYTNKLFSRNPKKDDPTDDIFVVYAKGGKTPFKVGDDILKHRKITSSYGLASQVISLKEVLNECLNRGYNKVVMIDHSCETCLQIEDEYDGFTPRYAADYINAKGESPGKFLEKMPYNPPTFDDIHEADIGIGGLIDEMNVIKQELDKTETHRKELTLKLKEIRVKKFELQLKSKKALEDGHIIHEQITFFDSEMKLIKQELDKTETHRKELTLKLNELEKRYDEMRTEFQKALDNYTLAENEWGEKYTTDNKFNPTYQYLKPKPHTKITDQELISKFERYLRNEKSPSRSPITRKRKRRGPTRGGKKNTSL